MINDSLKKIGLTGGEIKIYLALLELGSTTTGELIKKSGISGSKTYEVLERLIKKGLVSSIIKNNVKYFESARPERILDYLNEKNMQIDEEKREIKKIIPQLILRQKEAVKSEAKIYSGWEGMKTANEDIINSLKKGEEWLSMGLTEQPESWEIYFNKKHIERAKKGIIHKAIINEKYKKLYKERGRLPHTEYRFFPKELEMPTSVEIYSDKIAIFILSQESPLVILIENKKIAESYKNHFEILWEKARK